jgi:hypothetical protein
MTNANTDRLAYAGVLVVVTPLGLMTKFYGGPVADWVSNYAGGFLYVLFWVFVCLVLVPRVSPRVTALWVLAITCALEVLQLWHPPFLRTIRSTFAGRALIGTTFVWWDFIYYIVAAAVSPALARLAVRVARRFTSATHQE